MATVDLTDVVDKEHAGKGFGELLKLPPSALKGVTEKDAEALHAAFGIRTIADMGRSKYFKVAEAIVAMSAYDGK